jgi:hypothetical protein
LIEDAKNTLKTLIETREGLRNTLGMLGQGNVMQITSNQIKKFIKICSGNEKLSNEIKNAANLLDKKGF